MEVREISKEQLTNEYRGFLTVGDLKEFLYRHNLPTNAKVVIQRVEDFYFEKNQWGVYLKETGDTIRDEDGNVVKESMNQYHPAWCCVRYQDDSDVLFIDMHY